MSKLNFDLTASPNWQFRTVQTGGPRPSLWLMTTSIWKIASKVFNKNYCAPLKICAYITAVYVSKGWSFKQILMDLSAFNWIVSFTQFAQMKTHHLSVRGRGLFLINQWEQRALHDRCSSLPSSLISWTRTESKATLLVICQFCPLIAALIFTVTLLQNCNIVTKIDLRQAWIDRKTISLFPIW